MVPLKQLVSMTSQNENISCICEYGKADKKFVKKLHNNIKKNPVLLNA